MAINVLSCFDIVYCIYNEIKSSPEVIIENDFILLTDSQLQGLKVRASIDGFADSTGSLTFIFADMFLSEEELSV